MLKKIKLTHKLVLMLCAVAAPLIGATLYATHRGLSQDLQTAHSEKQGLAYARPLEALLDALPQHQTLALAATRGDVAAKTALLEKEVEMDQHLSDLENAHAKNGAALAATAAGALDVAGLKADWQKLKADSQSSDTADGHRQLTRTVRDLLSQVGQATHLSHDPAPGTRPLADTVLETLPQTQEHLGELVRQARDLQSRDPNTITPADLAPLAQAAALLQLADAPRLQAALETAPAGGDNAGSTLKPALENWRQASSDLVTQLNQHTAPSTAETGPARSAALEALSRAATGAARSAHDLWKAAAAELDRRLTQRAGALRQAQWLTLGGTLLGLLAGVGVAWLMARQLTRGLTQLTTAAQRVLRGESAVRAPEDGADEIGVLAKWFNSMLDARQKAQGTVEAEHKRLQASIQELLVVVSDASDGKLGVRAKVSEGVLGNVSDALNLMLENVGGIIANAKSASDQVASASTGISAVAQELEKGEQRQTQEILVTSEGVRDLNGKAQKVLENCQAATKAAENGRQAAEQGAKAVREVIKGMERIRENTQANAKKIKRLGDRSMEISGIVKVIGDISAKTDMLALNASIEAARAGEQGRGFTVVAEQVRSLADRTKTLTNQIEKLVGDIQKETAEAVAQMETQTQEVEAGARAAQSAGGTLENIVTVSSESSELVSQINQSASQQAVKTQEMLATVENINQVVAEAAVKVRETRSTSEQLLALSSELNKRLAQFETANESVVYEQPPA